MDRTAFRSILQLQGDPTGAVAALKVVEAARQQLGGTAVRVTETISSATEAKAAIAERRISSLQRYGDKLVRQQEALNTRIINSADRVRTIEEQQKTQTDALRVAEASLAAERKNQLNLEIQLADRTRTASEAKKTASMNRTEASRQRTERDRQANLALKNYEETIRSVETAEQNKERLETQAQTQSREYAANIQKLKEVEEQRLALMEHIEPIIQQAERTRAAADALKEATAIEREASIMMATYSKNLTETERLETQRANLQRQGKTGTEEYISVVQRLATLEKYRFDLMERAEPIIRKVEDLRSQTAGADQAANAERQATAAMQQYTSLLTEKQKLEEQQSLLEGKNAQTIEQYRNALTQLDTAQNQHNLAMERAEPLINAAEAARERERLALEQVRLAEVALMTRQRAQAEGEAVEDQTIIDKQEAVRLAREQLKTTTKELRERESQARQEISKADSLEKGQLSNQKQLASAEGQYATAVGHSATRTFQFGEGLRKAGEKAKQFGQTTMQTVVNVENTFNRMASTAINDTDRIGSGFMSMSTRIGSISVRLQGIQMGMANMGQQMLMVAQQGETFLLSAVQNTAIFDQQLVATAGVASKIPQSVMEPIRQMALDIGRDTQYTRSEGLTVIDELVRSGVKLDTIFGTLKDHSDGARRAVTTLRTATGSDLSEALNTVIVGTNVFARQNLKASEIIDMAGKAVNADKMTLKDFNEALKASGAVASELKIPYEEVTKSISTLARAGITGASAGTALKYFWQNAIPKSGVALKEMSQYGLATFNTAGAVDKLKARHVAFTNNYDGILQGLYKLSGGHGRLADRTAKDSAVFDKWMQQQHLVQSAFFDLQGNFKGTRNEIEMLGKALADKPLDQQMQVLRDVFGLKAGSTSAATFLTQFNNAMTEAKKTGEPLVDVFNRIQGAMNNMQSPAQIAAEKMATLEGRLKFIRGSFSALMNELTEPMQKPLTDMISFVGTIINNIEQRVSSNSSLREAISMAVMFVVAFAQIGGVALIVGAALPVVTRSIAALVAVRRPAVAGLALFGGVILGIANLFNDPKYGITSSLGGFAKLLKDTLPAARHRFYEVLGGVVIPISQLVAATLRKLVNSSGMGLVDFLGRDLPNAVSVSVNFFQKTLLPGLRSLAHWLGDRIPLAIGIVKDAFGLFHGVITDVVETLITGALPAFERLALFLLQQIPSAISFLHDTWTNDLFPIFQWLVNVLVNDVLPAGEQVVTWFQVIMPSAIGALVDVWSNLLQPIVETLVTFLIENLIPTLERVGSWFVNEVPSLAQTLMSRWNTVLWPVFSGLWNILTEKVLPRFEQVVAWLDTHLPARFSVLSTLWGTVLFPVLNSLVNIIGGQVLPALGNLFNFLVEVLPKAINALAQIWSYVLAPRLSFVVGIIAGPVFGALMGLVRILTDNLDVTLTAVASFLAINMARALFEFASTIYYQTIPALISLGIAFGPIIIAIAALAAAVRGFNILWTNDFLHIQEQAQLGIGMIRLLFSDFGKYVQDTITLLGALWKAMTGDEAGAKADRLKVYRDALEANLAATKGDVQQHIADVNTIFTNRAPLVSADGTLIGTSYKVAIGDQMALTEVDMDTHLNNIYQKFVTSAANVDGATRVGYAKIITTLKDSYNISLSDTTDWSTKTIAQVAAMAVPAGERATAAGTAIQKNLSDILHISVQDVTKFKTTTLGELLELKDPAALHSHEAGLAIRTMLSNELGISYADTANWKDMSIAQFVRLATPAGKAAQDAGQGIEKGLLTQLGISTTDLSKYKTTTLGTLASMVAPAGTAGYNTGYASSLGIAMGLDANMQAVVERIRFLRKQLGISIAIENRMSVATGPAQKVMLNEQSSIKNRNKTRADLSSTTQASGIPSYVLDLLAGPDPNRTPTNFGAYDPNGSTPNSKDSSNSDSNSDPNKKDNPYTGDNTNPYGPAPKPGSSKSGSSTTVSAAQAAADLITKTADRIKQGIAAFQDLAHLDIPTNLAAKAAQFADRAGQVVFQVQKVSLRFQSPNDDLLVHVTKFADAAVKSMDLVVKGVDAFAKLKDFQAPVRRQLDLFVSWVKTTVVMFAQRRSSFNLDGLVFTGEFADAATKVVDLIGKGVDAFAKLQDFVAPAQSQVQALVDAVQNTMLYLAPLAKQWAPTALDASAAFADRAGKVTENLSKAVDFFVKLQQLDVSMVGVVDKSKVIAQDSNQVLLDVQQMASGWTTQAATLVADYATRAGKVADGLLKAVDLLLKLADPTVDLHPSQQRIQALVADRAAMVRQIQTLPLGTAVMNKATSDFADTARKVADGLLKAVDLFQKLLDPRTLLGNVRQRVHDLAIEAGQMVVDVQGLWAEGWTPQLAQNTNLFADTAGKVADGLLKAADFFDKLRSLPGDPAELSGRVAALAVAARQMMDQVEVTLPPWVHLSGEVTRFADRSRKVADALTKSVDFFDKLRTSHTDFASLAGRVVELASGIRQMMDTLGPLARPWAGFSRTVTQFADRSSKVADGLLKTVDFFDKLGTDATSFKDLAGRAGEVIAAVVDMMNQVASKVPAGLDTSGLTPFFDRATKTADRLLKGQELFAKLGDGTRLGTSDQAATLAVSLVASVKAYQTALTEAVGTLDDTALTSADLDAKIADDQTKILGALTGAFDLLSKLSTYQPPSNFDPQSIFKAVLGFLLNRVQQFARRRQQFSQAVDRQTRQLADDIGKTTTGLGNAVELFVKLDTYKPVTVGAIDNFLGNLSYVVNRLKDGLLNNISPELLDLAQQFGTKLDPALKLLDTALSFFEKLMPTDTSTSSSTSKGTTDKSTVKGGFAGIDPTRIDAFINSLAYLIQKLKQGLLNQIAPDLLDLASQFGTKITPAIDAIGKALDIFLKIQGNGTKGSGLASIDPNAIGALVGDLYLLLHHWRNVIIGGEFQGDFQARSEAFATTVSVVLEQVQKVIDLATDIQNAEKATGAISKLPAMMQEIAVRLTEVLGVTLPATVGAAGQTLDQLNSQTSSKLGTAGATFQGFFDSIRQQFQYQSEQTSQGTLMWWWLFMLGLFIRYLEGKNGMHVQVRVGFENLFNELNTVFTAGMRPLTKGWIAGMRTLLSTTVDTIKQIKDAVKSLNDVSVTLTITTSGQIPTTGGNSSPPPPPGATGNSQAQGGNGATTFNLYGPIKVNSISDLKTTTRRQYGLAVNPM